jgi:heme exporter protein D
MIYWNSFSDFLAMGGYGFYVWGSFGATVLIMAIEPIVVARNQKATISRLKRQMRAESRAESPANSRAEQRNTAA